ncbi:MAG: AAA family ATPase [Desulfurococcaceae archaeon]|nr:MAG: AAA family ATPase [Desulfurococcaceae archaeon]
MKGFTEVVDLNRDVIQGNFTDATFAADLWEVFNNRGPIDYRDPERFFRRTFLTEGLRNLLEMAEKRLKGRGGDPVIQLQTPFGGGKTHSLIALYHKAKGEWGAKVIVIDGTALDPGTITLWGEMERQLRGKIEEFQGQYPPGREKLRALFEAHQPLLILIDEVLEYITRADAIKVGDTTLATQTLTFIRELTGAVSSLDKTLLVVTLPSSETEVYDERIFYRIRNILGRMEKIYTPVQDHEVVSVIRARLIDNVNEYEVEKIVDEFLNYAEKEGILPKGVERSEYREKFIKSYPFQPEVIEVLYHRWGSYPTFQRTRGVLRLLAHVLYSLKDSKIPFIRLCDFDLSNEEIRRELVKHIGPQYDSVIASDITSSDASAKKVDKSLGKAYETFKLGTKAATAIFLYSFSGRGEVGATLEEIKLACAEIDVPSNIITEVLSKLKESALYLHSNAKYYFSTTPNLNKILLVMMENVTEDEMRNEERKILESIFSKGRGLFKVYIWPRRSSDIPDDKKLKLVVMDSDNEEAMGDILKNHGKSLRTNPNTLIFLCPDSSVRNSFNQFLRSKIALEKILKDETIKLTEQQRKEVEARVNENKKSAKGRVRDLYRAVYLPSREGFKKIDLGVHTYGMPIEPDREIWDELKEKGELLEEMPPEFLREKYLGDKDYVAVKDILESLYTTPGEVRIASEEVLVNCVRKGVAQGIFGYGVLKDNKPECLQIGRDLELELAENVILTKPEICKKPIEIAKVEEKVGEQPIEVPIPSPKPSISERRDKPEVTIPTYKILTYKELHLELKAKPGMISEIMRLVSSILKPKFRSLDMTITVKIQAGEGEITREDYEAEVREMLRQLKEKGVEILKEEPR